MADGDSSAGNAASAIGLAVLTGIEKVRYMWRYLNSTRDMLANHITSGTHSASQITSGTLDNARLPSDPTFNSVKAAGGFYGGPSLNKGVGLDGGLYGTHVDVDSAVNAGGNGSFGGSLQANGTLISPWARANGISGGLSIYVRSDGVIGISASSRRFKKDIKSATIDVQAVLAMRVVEFHYRVAIDPDALSQVGLIAEELDELGLTWLVAYDDDGVPLTVHYEKLALALLPVVQDHERRLTDLEEATRA